MGVLTFTDFYQTFTMTFNPEKQPKGGHSCLVSYTGNRAAGSDTRRPRFVELMDNL
jgi:hypothetical protein